MRVTGRSSFFFGRSQDKNFKREKRKRNTDGDYSCFNTPSQDNLHFSIFYCNHEEGPSPARKKAAMTLVKQTARTCSQKDSPEKWCVTNGNQCVNHRAHEPGHAVVLDSRARACDLPSCNKTHRKEVRMRDPRKSSGQPSVDQKPECTVKQVIYHHSHSNQYSTQSESNSVQSAIQ